MLVEFILRQSRGDAVRIGTLEAPRPGDRVRIDGCADWVIVRCRPPGRRGGRASVVCERVPAVSRAA